jgi:saccharopine dehydrogenase-like NADP-dependent oxidoreductase
VRATTAIRAIADESDHAFMPQCGLAPGFIGIAAHELANRFTKSATSRCASARCRVSDQCVEVQPDLERRRV